MLFVVCLQTDVLLSSKSVAAFLLDNAFTTHPMRTVSDLGWKI